MENELSYPFAEKEAQYRENSIEQLNAILLDAREASQRAEEMYREGFAFSGRKGPGWRMDDLHTICKIRGEKMEKLGLLGPRVIDFSKGM